jgi:hypothetical protein
MAPTAGVTTGDPPQEVAQRGRLLLAGQQGSLSTTVLSHLSNIRHGALLFIGSLLLILCGGRALSHSGVGLDL